MYYSTISEMTIKLLEKMCLIEREIQMIESLYPNTDEIYRNEQHNQTYTDFVALKLKIQLHFTQTFNENATQTMESMIKLIREVEKKGIV